AVTWVRKINEQYQLSMLATTVYRYPTLKQLSGYIAEEAQKRGTVPGRVAAAPAVALAPVPQEARNASIDRGVFRKLASWRNRAPSRGTSFAGLRQPIAVIGMAGQFPKAKTLEEFWQNIARGLNCVTEVPAHRWNVDTYYSGGEVSAGKTNCRWMGAL